MLRAGHAIDGLLSLSLTVPCARSICTRAHILTVLSFFLCKCAVQIYARPKAGKAVGFHDFVCLGILPAYFLLIEMRRYGRVNGVHVCESSFFLQDILRKEWGFDGPVISDWYRPFLSSHRQPLIYVT